MRVLKGALALLATASATNYTLITANGVWLQWLGGIPFSAWTAGPMQMLVERHLEEYNARIWANHGDRFNIVLYDHRATELDGYKAAIQAQTDYPDAIAYANCGWDAACTGVSTIATVFRKPIVEGSATKAGLISTNPLYAYFNRVCVTGESTVTGTAFMMADLGWTSTVVVYDDSPNYAFFAAGANAAGLAIANALMLSVNATTFEIINHASLWSTIEAGNERLVAFYVATEALDGAYAWENLWSYLQADQYQIVCETATAGMRQVAQMAGVGVLRPARVELSCAQPADQEI